MEVGEEKVQIVNEGRKYATLSFSLPRSRCLSLSWVSRIDAEFFTSLVVFVGVVVGGSFYYRSCGSFTLFSTLSELSLALFPFRCSGFILCCVTLALPRRRRSLDLGTHSAAGYGGITCCCTVDVCLQQGMCPSRYEACFRVFEV